jgi:hypothetical protein
MPKFHRHRARYARPWHSFNSALWLIGLGILFLWGDWWPGILILVGLSLLLQGILGASTPQVVQEDVEPAAPPAVSTPRPVSVEPEITAPISPLPINNTHRADLLPTTCPNCGGPARASEVKWTGPQSAACGYCGSALPMKKS